MRGNRSPDGDGFGLLRERLGRKTPGGREVSDQDERATPARWGEGRDASDASSLALVITQRTAQRAAGQCNERSGNMAFSNRHDQEMPRPRTGKWNLPDRVDETRAPRAEGRTCFRG